MTLPGSRIINGLGVFGTVVSMLFAYLYLQQYLGLPPCPLCMIDRAIVVALGILFFIALIHKPNLIGQRIYAVLTALVASTGIAVCIRHIWLQNLPKDQIPTCAPDLDYMLDVLPLSETLSVIFNTSGECADTQWTFMNLSIPEQTLLVFTGFLGLSAIQLFRKTV